MLRWVLLVLLAEALPVQTLAQALPLLVVAHALPFLVAVLVVWELQTLHAAKARVIARAVRLRCQHC